MRHVTETISVRPPRRWAVVTAHLITLLVLPSGLWRLGIALGFSMGTRAAAAHPVRGGEAVYVLGLSLVSEALALASLGLVRPWGETLPARLPVLGGRRVPPPLATATAATGAVALIVLWGYAAAGFVVHTVLGPPGAGLSFTSGWWEALLVACYAPLLLWGPLLLALAVSHRKRVTRRLPGRLRAEDRSAGAGPGSPATATPTAAGRRPPGGAR